MNTFAHLQTVPHVTLLSVVDGLGVGRLPHLGEPSPAALWGPLCILSGLRLPSSFISFLYKHIQASQTASLALAEQVTQPRLGLAC